MERPPLVRRQRLSAPCAEIRALHADARAGRKGRDGRGPRRRRATGRRRDRARRPRGHHRRVVHQLAQDPDAVGHRPRRPSGRTRHRGRGRPRGRGPEPARPSGTVPASRLAQENHPLPLLEPFLQGADRGTVAAVENRAGHVQPVRKCCLYPQQGRREIPRYSVPFPAHGRAL